MAGHTIHRHRRDLFARSRIDETQIVVALVRDEQHWMRSFFAMALGISKSSGQTHHGTPGYHAQK